MTTLRIAAPFQTSFSVVTDQRFLADALLKSYGSYIRESSERSDIVITVVPQDDGFAVSANGNTAVVGDAFCEIDRIIFENNKYDGRVLAFHGAAVESQGKAYLFLAATTSGKTTLASYLVSRGFGYITDDCILVDRSELSVHPYAAPVHLRKGGLEVLKRYGAEPKSLETLSEAWEERYVYMPENRVEVAVPLGAIYFITRTEAVNELSPMTSNECMMQLLGAPITDYPVTADYLRLMSRLVPRCRRLVYSDMEFVAEVILNG